MGHAYSPWFGGRRKVENFLCAQHVAIDMDTADQRSTLSTLQENPFFRMYGAVIHTTPSHTAKAPKARLIFRLDEPISTADGYKAAISTVAVFFPGHDVSCIDAARFFYGNAHIQQNIDDIYFAEGLLPVADLRAYHKLLRVHVARAQHQTVQPDQQRRPAEVTDRYVQTAVQNEGRTLSTTPVGGRNHQLNKSAFALGTLVGAGSLAESVAREQLWQAAQQAGLGQAEIEKTLWSGLRAGIAESENVTVYKAGQSWYTGSNNFKDGFRRPTPGETHQLCLLRLNGSLSSGATAKPSTVTDSAGAFCFYLERMSDMSKLS